MPLPIVLLRGFLDSNQLKKIYAEILTIIQSHNTLNMVIDSIGGDVASVMEFVLAVNELKALDINIKVYKAQSAAAFLVAVINATKKEMCKDLTIGFHRGEFKIDPTDIDSDGKLNKNLLKEYRRYEQMLVDVLCEKKVLGDPMSNAEFYGSNWIKLDATMCIKHGIVHELF